jgi:hypothetical protein
LKIDIYQIEIYFKLIVLMALFFIFCKFLPPWALAGLEGVLGCQLFSYAGGRLEASNLKRRRDSRGILE